MVLRRLILLTSLDEKETKGQVEVESKLLKYMGYKVTLGPATCWGKWQDANGSMQNLFHN